MAQIGLFTRTAEGFSGRLRTLSLAAELTLVRIEPPAGGNAPDYRIPLGDGSDGPEARAGRTRPGGPAGCGGPLPGAGRMSRASTGGWRVALGLGGGGRLLLAAVQFLTRVPLRPSSYDPGWLPRAAKYFPLAGIPFRCTRTAMPRCCQQQPAPATVGA